MAELYDWIKAFHIIAVVTWFAALFYLPRLFVYHTQAPKGDHVGRERFCVMERKLYRGIMTPSAVVAVGLGGVLLAMAPLWLDQTWMQAKLVLVALLLGYHLYCGRLVRVFARGDNQRTHVWYRVFNELPVLVLVAVVVLAVVRPF